MTQASVDQTERKKRSKKMDEVRSILRWTPGMVETLLELRFDTTKTSCKIFQAAKNNPMITDAWNKLAVCFNELHPFDVPIDVAKLKSWTS